MRLGKLTLALTLGAAMSIGVHSAQARDKIRIVGSSTVFPFSTTVAERFGKSTSFNTPVVESTGTGGGMKLFCAGIGVGHPDITNASRRIKKSEFEDCKKNGIEIVEVKVGFDGIVLANAKNAKPYNLTNKQIFQALAAKIPVDGKLVDNPNKTWSDVDSSLPKTKIEVLGPPPTSGTRDAFVELAMESGAKAFPMLATLKKEDKKKFKAVAHHIREDGVFIEAGENDNLIVQKLKANPDALGVFGFSFLEQNENIVKGATVNGSDPSFENISSGKYAISRSLYFYVKKQHIGVVPGIKEFVNEFTNDKAWGDDGYLVDKGLIPLPAAEREEVAKNANSLTPLDM